MNLKKIMLAGKEVWPIIEGGKGISITTGLTAGKFAAEGACGTFSGVNPDSYDENGNPVKREFKATSWAERQKEMVQYAIAGGVAQAEIAHKESNGEGRIFMNVLWEMGASQDVLEGVLSRAKGMIHGITCGAGMPFNLSEIAAKFKVYYNPIVSSSRAFKLLWKRAYKKHAEWLGGVVYEDPWLAGGHNGLSNSESPDEPQDPYNRIAELRAFMNEMGLKAIPIIIAGGVWALSEWKKYIDNEEIGPVAFQFGTRPLVTVESPIGDDYKQKLLTLDEGDVSLQKFSPTGFYSSAARNKFLRNLEARSERQIAFKTETDSEFSIEFAPNAFITKTDSEKVVSYQNDGFSIAMKTPDNTFVFVSPEENDKIKDARRNCVGCLSACQFSGWTQYEGLKIKPDPRSFCIQKTLWDLAHGGKIEDNLMFAGHMAFRFKNDPLYANGHIPTIAELIEVIKSGN